jgi:radical SAM modification target selenobiotic family peptide
MDSKDLKKILAGVSIVSLLGAAAVTSGCAHGQSS